MIVFVDILVAIVLIVCGYIATCYYLNEKKWNSKDVSSLKLSRNKCMYLCGAVLTCATIVTVLQTIYDLDGMRQIKLLALVLCLFPIAAVDFRTQKIPNQFIIAALIIRVLFYIPEVILSPRNTLVTFVDNLLGAFVISLFFILLLLVFKNSIGMGDIKLFIVMGMYQGLWGAVNSVFFSLIVSFFISVILLLTKRKKRTDTIAFGPSILLGTIVGICLAGM